MNSNVYLFRKIFSMENLYYAWCKAKYVYDFESDFVYGRAKMVAFEANLNENLAILSKKIKLNQYHLSPLVPMALPKDAEEADNENTKRSRQNFHVYLEDQIVWIAVVNVIGPIFDANMPFWSFGNRLHMPIWKEENDESGKSKIKFGTYRPSSRKLYRSWSSSWPLFRKAISITVKKMGWSVSLSQEEQDDVSEYNSYAPKDLAIKYWEPTYWNTESDCNVYYAAIDLSKFYPSVDTNRIFSSQTVNEILYPNRTDCEDALALKDLLLALTDFHIDENHISMDIDSFPHQDSDIKGISFKGIPTGLFVAGFLSNIAMLDIDILIMKKIDSSRKIAHFRFVDDHVILATSVEDLRVWITEYESILKKFMPRVELNINKTQPQEFASYLQSKQGEKYELIGKVENKCKLDKNLPSPFTTLTIKKMSVLNRMPFEIMGENEKIEFISGIEHVLATEFPEEEIKKSTRVSWAASILGRIVPTVEFDIEKKFEICKLIESKYYELKKIGQFSKYEYEDIENRKKEIVLQIEALNREKNKIIEAANEKETRLYSQSFALLQKALNDNISKPKIWKKIIRFCWSTGYNGFDRIFRTLDENQTLTNSGKSYLLSTMLGEISNEIICHSNTSHVFCEVSDDTNLRRQKLILYFELYWENVLKLTRKYNSFFTNEILMQFNFALRYSKTEKTKESYFVNDNYLNEQAIYLWVCFSKPNGDLRMNPPVAWQQLVDLIKENDELYKEHYHIISKLLLMYPESLDLYFSTLLMNRKILTRRTFDELNKEGIKGYINLFSWCNHNSEVAKKANHVRFDLFQSEWVALEICKSIINKINIPIDVDTFEELGNRDFYNCHPCNFYIKANKVKMAEDLGWNKIKSRLNSNPNETIKLFKEFDDIRFHSEFYNEWSVINNDKRQVYSIGILLLMLLNPSFSFNPLINRGDVIEKRHYLLLDQLNECNISSYTRAIIAGALCNRNFELQQLSYFDQFFIRDRDNMQDPISVESANDLLKHIDVAQEELVKFQLSLENNAPRQLIPVSLRNLSISYNPYLEGEVFV